MFFWWSDETKRKYRLTKWNRVCRTRDQGGLGIEVLERVWQELLHNKYLRDKRLAQVQEKPTDSQFWKGLIRVKQKFFNMGDLKVGNGEGTIFLEDVWLGDVPLANQ